MFTYDVSIFLTSTVFVDTKILLIGIVYQPMLYFGDKRSSQNVIDAFCRNSIGGIINCQNRHINIAKK